MLAVTKPVVALYVARSSQQWIVRDLESKFWSLPSTDKPRDEHQPFSPAEETDRKRVPGHYMSMLGLPP
jgi:hypothetical protein